MDLTYQIGELFRRNPAFADRSHYFMDGGDFLGEPSAQTQCGQGDGAFRVC
jgi:hypothetical protein